MQCDGNAAVRGCRSRDPSKPYDEASGTVNSSIHMINNPLHPSTKNRGRGQKAKQKKAVMGKDIRYRSLYPRKEDYY